MHLLKMVIREHKKGCNCIEPTLAWGNVFEKRELQERCTWKIIYYMPK
jgi:hypothetical protein